MANHLYDALFGPHESTQTPFLLRPGQGPVSYGDFLALASRVAGVMAEHGIATGNRVAVQVKKSVEALAVYAACVRAGAVFLPLNPAYTPTEVEYFVTDAEAALLVCDPTSAAVLLPLAAKVGAKLFTLGGDGAGSLIDAARGHGKASAVVPRGSEDLAAFLYTSGTTGRSKGAMLTQGNLLSNARTLVDAWRFTAEDVLLHALPIFHTHGLFVATNITLLAGGTMIFLPGLDIDDLIAQMPNATAMMGVPTFYTRLLADPRFSRELTAHMRLFVSGSAPLLAETHAEFAALTGHRILERYGMTETNMNTSNPYEGERRAGTIGFPLDGVEIRICEAETGRPRRQGEIGVIEVRGPNVFKGYWKMPEKTAQELRADGFFITGDLGRIDADGYISIVGRAKDLIIAGGYNIYPQEVESVLDDNPVILESAVVGVPHPDLGEAVIAVVTLRGNAVFDEGAVLAGLRDRLARFKQPRRILVIDELPRNAMGKVQKALLRARFGGLFLPSG
jgi:malonyl-CoA/methylmalonyl-CoA synthetase